jgi:hypothetical protein
MRNAYEVLYGNLEGRGHVGGLCVGGRVLSKRIYGFYGLKMGTGLKWFRIGSKGRLL